MTRYGSLTDGLHQQLREAILSGELSPGTAISEGTLAAQYGVSKTPVREALARLRAEELVRVIPYKGYYVAPISLRDVQSLYQVRLILETGAAELAARMVTPPEAEELMALARATAPDSIGSVQANVAFHIGIAASIRNDRLQALIRDCIEKLQRVLYLDTVTADPLVQVAEHTAIAASIGARDAASAKQLIGEHIERSQRRGLEQILSGENHTAD